MPKNKLNYEKDKNGWVIFNTRNERKQKLRKYISNLANELTKLGLDNYGVNRGILIDAYNTDGLDGLKHVMRVKLTELQQRIN